MNTLSLEIEQISLPFHMPANMQWKCEFGAQNTNSSFWVLVLNLCPVPTHLGSLEPYN